MKFIINKRREEEVKLYLEDYGEEITLRCYDKDGTSWNVMEFKNGKFRRNLAVPNNIGIEVDGDGRIEESK